jgi:hypothetical protein
MLPPDELTIGILYLERDHEKAPCIVERALGGYAATILRTLRRSVTDH